jgi:hypothetical protein
MADAVSRIDPNTQDHARRVAPPSTGSPVPFLIPVTWNSLTASLLPVHIGADGAGQLTPAGWDEPSAETEPPARWAMVVPKMDREASGDPK